MSKIFNRRSAMGLVGGAASAASVLGSLTAQAKLIKGDMEPRGTIGKNTIRVRQTKSRRLLQTAGYLFLGDYPDRCAGRLCH